MKFYYRKRLETYIQVLREKLQSGDTKVIEDKLTPFYRKIELDFLDNPLVLNENDFYKGTPTEAVSEVLSHLQKIPYGN